MRETLNPTVRRRLSDLVAERTGLHFPPERHQDLERGLAEAAAASGFANSSEYATWLLSTELAAPELRSLASHLTIGETYFFRERPAFDALSSQLLPEIIARRRAGERRLRLWSAACSSGEEAYSLAILAQQLLPDIEDWHVSVLGTDINPRFLARAQAGIYGEWSFRDTGPELRERYFERLDDKRYEIKPAIRRLVTFAELNLAADSFPSLATDTNAMDVILCRNVLIYFTPEHTRALVEKLRRALLDDAWLIVSPAEYSQAVFAQFTATNFPGTVLYRKRAPRAAPAPAASPSFTAAITAPAPRPVQAIAPAIAPTPAAPAASEPLAVAREHFAAGRFAEAVDAIAQEPKPEAQSLLARALANLGRLEEAAAAAECWLSANKLDASAHYLHAMIQQELGEVAGARQALARAVYLDGTFALAHFALGNLALGAARGAEARRHFANALKALEALAPEAAVPESEGLTAARLREIIATLVARLPRSVIEH
jgi:chemotaxis protein methyltransferase CheR